MKPMLSIEAAEPDVYMGLGSAAYALAKADGHLHPEELDTIRRLFSAEIHGDLAIRSFLIQEYHDETTETAYAFALRRLTASRHLLTDDLKAHLLSLLTQVAQAQPADSARENALLRLFRRDLRKL